MENSNNEICQEELLIAYMLVNEIDSELLNVYQAEDREEREREEREAEALLEELEENRKKKKKNSNSSKKNNDDTFKTSIRVLPECTFAELGKTQEITVSFLKHDMRYKEQQWPIPDRDIIYNVERIDNPKQAVDAAEFINKNFNSEIKDKAYNGETRYYRIVTYEAITSDLVNIGYIEIRSDKKFRLKLNEKVLNTKNVSIALIKERVNKAIKNIVKFK